MSERRCGRAVAEWLPRLTLTLAMSVNPEICRDAADAFGNAAGQLWKQPCTEAFPGVTECASVSGS
jgi:hypothetical protein